MLDANYISIKKKKNNKKLSEENKEDRVQAVLSLLGGKSQMLHLPPIFAEKFSHMKQISSLVFKERTKGSWAGVQEGNGKSTRHSEQTGQRHTAHTRNTVNKAKI